MILVGVTSDGMFYNGHGRETSRSRGGKLSYIASVDIALSLVFLNSYTNHLKQNLTALYTCEPMCYPYKIKLYIQKTYCVVWHFQLSCQRNISGHQFSGWYTGQTTAKHANFSCTSCTFHMGA